MKHYLKHFLQVHHLGLSKNHHEIVKQLSPDLLEFSHKPIEEIFSLLKTEESGLDHNEVVLRKKKYGPNEIAHEKPITWYNLLLRNFTNPFIALVLILGIVSFFLKEYDAVVIITFMVLISVLMRFIQEFRSNNAAEKLRALVSTKATVLRKFKGESQSHEIAIKQLVPGDIVHLSAGDMVPADVRIIRSKGLYVSQATLSGEAMPIEKKEGKNAQDNVKNPLDFSNLCFLGTSVLNGTAQALVVKTGQATYFGSMAKGIVGVWPLTSFDLGVNKISWLLIRFILIRS